ncbi:hypothetical protein FOA52_012254 [Chlamydomonas sp. UWO 241]|nr:hypothetical protein FOA52_012254 [Chlamydomonas sp. UWO 241]
MIRLAASRLLGFGPLGQLAGGSGLPAAQWCATSRSTTGTSQHGGTPRPITAADIQAANDHGAGAGASRPRSVELAAHIAGIRAAKMTSSLIPLCHNINLSKVGVAFEPLGGDDVRVVATASASGQTGIEMEALAAAAFAAINLLGARQGAAPGIGRIRNLQLELKEGGKSGSWLRPGFGHRGVAFLPPAAAVDADAEAAPGPSSLLDLVTRAQDAVSAVSGPHGATATARLSIPLPAWQQLVDNVNKKGDVLGVARLAGIMAADSTRVLVAPGCGATAYQQQLQIDVVLSPSAPGRLDIAAHAACHGPHGVNMVALTCAAVAALTVYDMCKASSKGTVIEDLAVAEVSGQ